MAACPRRSRGRGELSLDGGAPAGEEEQDRVQEVQGGEGELAEGSFGAEGDRRGELHGAAAPAAANGDGGGVPAGLGGRDLAVELQGEVGMPFRGLAWTEEGWRRELGGGARAAAMAGGCGSRSGKGSGGSD